MGMFFCLVLMHSENIHHQELCVELWQDISNALSPDDPCHKFDPIFTKHLLVIKSFGCFLTGMKPSEGQQLMPRRSF
jgi:uncharacterized protein (DUF924 family)